MTRIALIGPWQLALPLFCLARVLFCAQTVQVTTLLVAFDHPGLAQSDKATLKRHIWLHALAMTVFVMMSPPAKLFDIATGLLFFFFIFRLSLTDLLTGWLPREWTWSLLLAGLLQAAGHDVLTAQGITALALFLVFWAVRSLGGHYAKREVLGLGDVWLITGLGAWLSGPPLLFTLLAGCSGFVLWHYRSQERSRGGPLGPWLGYSALVAMTIGISDPLLIG